MCDRLASQMRYRAPETPGSRPKLTSTEAIQGPSRLWIRPLPGLQRKTFDQSVEFVHG